MSKPLMKRLVLLLASASQMALAAVIVNAAEQKIPEYIGSQACLGCHADKYSQWKPSNHANMVVPIINTTDLPLDISQAPAKLQAELQKAAYIVAGSFFMAKDPTTQHYKMLSVTYDKATKAYRPSGFSLDWSTQCAGCHTTNMNTPKLTWGESGIGCEACHGPGRDHALSKGDKSKIVSSKDADICGQCHGGNDAMTGGKLMADGTKWIVGYRPGMKLAEMQNVQLTPVDPKKTPPDSNVTANHLRNYNMWAASGHSKALSLIINTNFANADCYGCHSAEGFAAKLKGAKVDVSKKSSFSTITCVACHDPHDGDNPLQLVVAPEKLCISCHVQGPQDAMVKGTAVKNIEETRSAHSGFNCVQCHMTEANHLMRVIRPDAPDLDEKRADTCTSCHKNSSKKDRGAKLQEWQASFTKDMDSLQADLKTISAAMKEKPDVFATELKTKVNSVRGDLSLLTRDGSRGAHNFEYFKKVMDQAGNDLDAAKAAMKK
jgi:predicted CXXCH cytochrome family protein